MGETDKFGELSRKYSVLEKEYNSLHEILLAAQDGDLGGILKGIEGLNEKFHSSLMENSNLKKELSSMFSNDPDSMSLEMEKEKRMKLEKELSEMKKKNPVNIDEVNELYSAIILSDESRELEMVELKNKLREVEEKEMELRSIIKEKNKELEEKSRELENSNKEKESIMKEKESILKEKNKELENNNREKEYESIIKLMLEYLENVESKQRESSSHISKILKLNETLVKEIKNKTVDRGEIDQKLEEIINEYIEMERMMEDEEELNREYRTRISENKIVIEVLKTNLIDDYELYKEIEERYKENEKKISERNERYIKEKERNERFEKEMNEREVEIKGLKKEVVNLRESEKRERREIERLKREMSEINAEYSKVVKENTVIYERNISLSNEIERQRKDELERSNLIRRLEIEKKEGVGY